jgi:hypothetical protein
MFKLHMPCRGVCRNPRRPSPHPSRPARRRSRFVVGLSKPAADCQSYRRGRGRTSSALRSAFVTWLTLAPRKPVAGLSKPLTVIVFTGYMMLYRVIQQYWTAADASMGIGDFSSVAQFALSSNLIRQLAKREPCMPDATTRPRVIIAPKAHVFG